MGRGLILLLLAACSSRPQGGTTSGTGAPPPDAAGVAAPADAAGPGPLTREDCEQLIDHIIAVQNAELRAKKPPEEWPTEEQLAEMRANLITEMMDQCVVWDRPSFDCIMAASTVDTLYACAQ
jgi:hypothetical protein